MVKSNVSYSISNLAPRYDYTDAMYKEDYRIAHWFVYEKCPYRFPEKSITKEDLLQWCVTKLWQVRPQYDPAKSKYTTWAIMICRNVLRYYSIIKRQYEDAQRTDLDNIIYTDEDGNTLVLLETLGQTDKDPVDDLVRIVYQAVDNIHTPVPRAKAKQVVDLFISGKVEYLAQAAAIMGCTREYCRQLFQKVRMRALRIINNGNTFARSKCERQIAIIKQTPPVKKKRGRPRKLPNNVGLV